MTKIQAVVLAVLLLLPNLAYSQKNESKLGADISAGYVTPSHKFLTGRNLAQKPVNRTVSAHLKYGIQLGPHTELGRKYPNTYQGIGISYHHFFNDRELGSPFGIYIFQHSRIVSLAPKLSLDYEWDFGINWNWIKYDRITNPYQRLMGSTVTAYINIGSMMNWNFAPQWNFTAGIDFTHVSNGNTSYPNYGLNTITLKTGLTRSFNSQPPAPAVPSEKFKRHVTYDLVLFGSWRKKVFDIGIVEYELKENFPVAGLNFNPLYNVCKYFRTGFSLDILYDRTANIQNHIISADKETRTVEYENPPFHEQLSVGLSARAELIMPIFSVNIGIGKHVLASGEDKGLMYEVIALKTSVTPKLFLHTGCVFYNLQASRCLMLGLGYRL